MNHIEQIKQKLDIVEYIGHDVDFKRAGRLLKACCPFHDEKTPSFMVDPQKQTWHCYGSCQEGGDIFSYVMKKEGLEFGEALRLLAQRSGVELPAHYSPEEHNKEKRLLELNAAAQNFYFDLMLSRPQAEKARAYLKERQVGEKAIADFKLGYAPPDGKSLLNHLKERNFSETEMLETSLIVRSDNGQYFDRFKDVITYPICNRTGQCVGFGVRIMDAASLKNGHAKYVNTAKNRLFDKSNLLYALHLAAPFIRQQNEAIIMEGYMDVIAAHQAGYQNCVASMGTAVTEKQIEQIKKLTNNLVMALDNDKAGQEAAQKCAPFENTINGEIKILHITSGKDPDEFIKEHAPEWPDLVEKAVPVIDYLIELETAKVDLQAAGGKSNLIKALSPTLAAMNDSVRREHYLQKLAQMVGINAQTIKREIQKATKEASVTQTTTEKAVIRHNSTFALEEYILCLLAQNTELIEECPAEAAHFNDFLNKSIYSQIKKDYNSNFAASFDVISSERWQVYKGKNLPGGESRLKMLDCCRRLKQAFLKDQAERKSAMLAERTYDTQDEVKHLKSLGINEAQQLQETFKKRVERR